MIENARFKPEQTDTHVLLFGKKYLKRHREGIIDVNVYLVRDGISTLMWGKSKCDFAIFINQ